MIFLSHKGIHWWVCLQQTMIEKMDRRYLLSLKMNNEFISRLSKRSVRKKKPNRKVYIKYVQAIQRRTNPNGWAVCEKFNLSSNQRNANKDNDTAIWLELELQTLPCGDVGTQEGSFPAVGRINWFPYSGGYEDKLVSSCYRSIVIYLVKLSVLMPRNSETISHRNSLPKPEEGIDIQHCTILEHLEIGGSPGWLLLRKWMNMEDLGWHTT